MVTTCLVGKSPEGWRQPGRETRTPLRTPGVAQAAGVAAVGSWYHTAQAASKAPIMSSEEASLFSVP
jgi:hypothetical protein